MFDPKITEGDWISNATETVAITQGKNGREKIMDRDYIISTTERGRGSIAVVLHNPEDAKAIAAVPELLDVYMAAKNTPGLHGELVKVNDDGTEDWVVDERLKKLSDAIKKLEERHCNG